MNGFRAHPWYPPRVVAGAWPSVRAQYGMIALFIAALLCDAASTTHFMLLPDPPPELHPLVRWAAHAFGPIAGPFLGAAAKALAGLVVACYLPRWAPHLFLITASVALWAAWHNVWGRLLV